MRNEGQPCEFTLSKMHLKISSEKWQHITPASLCLSILIKWRWYTIDIIISLKSSTNHIINVTTKCACRSIILGHTCVNRLLFNHDFVTPIKELMSYRVFTKDFGADSNIFQMTPHPPGEVAPAHQQSIPKSTSTLVRVEWQCRGHLSQVRYDIY